MNTPPSEEDANSKNLRAFLEAMEAEEKKSPVVQGDPAANPVESLLNLLRLMEPPRPGGRLASHWGRLRCLATWNW